MTKPLLHVPFEAPLREGRLLRRYHRFLADIRLDDGRTVVAHCVNSGAMEGLVRSEARVWAYDTGNTERKLQWTWELTEHSGALGTVIVGSNTNRPNQVVKQLLTQGLLPGVAAGTPFQPEQKYGERSRIDFLLQEPAGPRYVEIKNCHVVYPDGYAYFPDSVSERGTKHLEELTALAQNGVGASVYFFVQRADAGAVRPSDVHDPAFAAAARVAGSAGVVFRALRVQATLTGLDVVEEMPVDLEPYDLAPVRSFRAQEKPFGGWQRPKKIVEASTPELSA